VFFIRRIFTTNVCHHAVAVAVAVAVAAFVLFFLLKMSLPSKTELNRIVYQKINNVL